MRVNLLNVLAVGLGGTIMVLDKNIDGHCMAKLVFQTIHHLPGGEVLIHESTYGNVPPPRSIGEGLDCAYSTSQNETGCAGKHSHIRNPAEISHRKMRKTQPLPG
ncbi:hypothetical protein [Pseudomonas sp. efr-133-TYG-103a]|uniref:hypothetical protein n=1 Tax=Pseudomonas sp. efr-133-TYG-103a TaxID=3040308 RepID=UPI0025558D4A|nr:hypothetical protein [Pseudomonas sp. efr-133-TYG-103a]